MNDFPNAHLLVDVPWLAARTADPMTVILDVRAAGRSLPGARPFRLSYALGEVGGTPGCLLVGALVRQLGMLGVRPEQTVVLCGEGLGTTVSQAFWALERVGHSDVRILTEGVAGWAAAGGDLVDGWSREPAWAPTDYQPVPNDGCLADADWLQSRPDALLLDARRPQEFCAGHIPGARLCPWESTLQPDGPPRLAAAPALRTRFDSLGVGEAAEVVTYCRSGARASFLYLVLRLLGQPRLRNFDGSLLEWSLRELPFETTTEAVGAPAAPPKGIC